MPICVSELVRNLRLEANPYSIDAADALETQTHEIERLKRILVACAKQSQLDEGAIDAMVAVAIGTADYDKIWGEINDEELHALAYPQGIVTQMIVETMEGARHFVDTFGLPILVTMEGVVVLVTDHEGVEYIVGYGLAKLAKVVISKEVVDPGDG